MIHENPGGLPLTKRLIDYCGLKPAAKVVDVGCGTGETVQYLRDKHGIDAVGVDLAANRLKEGKSRFPDLPLVEAAAENMPFASFSIEAVIAECSLSVMRDTGTVIAEISRILITGGKLALTDVYDKNPDSSLPSVFLTYTALTGLLAENGFKVLIWEDHSACLGDFAACFIMKYGSIQQLWQCLASSKNPLGNGHKIKINKPGYFLLVAEKKG